MRSYTVWQCLALSFWALWKTESYLLLLFDFIISPSSLTQLHFCGRFQAKLAKFLGNQFKFVFAFPWVSVTWVCEPSRSCVNWWLGNTITRVGRLLVKKNWLVGEMILFFSVEYAFVAVKSEPGVLIAEYSSKFVNQDWLRKESEKLISKLKSKRTDVGYLPYIIVSQKIKNILCSER